MARRTVGEAWDLVGGQLADDAPTQPEVIQISQQLYAANSVETDVPPDAMVLLRRHKQLQKRQMQGRMMNVLFPRIPLWDCDRFLKRWMPLVAPVPQQVRRDRLAGGGDWRRRPDRTRSGRR